MSRTRKPPQKSPSERLRAVYYQLYQQEKPNKEFEEFYTEKMELLIEHYKKLIKQPKI